MNIPCCTDIRQDMHCVSCHMDAEDEGLPYPYKARINGIRIGVCCKVAKDFAAAVTVNKEAFPGKRRLSAYQAR